MAKETFPSCFSRWASFLPCCCLVTKLCPTLCDPTDCSLSGSSVHGISQARYWGRLPFPSPGDLPDPGIEPASPALQADSLLLSQWGSAPPHPLLPGPLQRQRHRWGKLHLPQSHWQEIAPTTVENGASLDLSGTVCKFPPSPCAYPCTHFLKPESILCLVLS